MNPAYLITRITYALGAACLLLAFGCNTGSRDGQAGSADKDQIHTDSVYVLNFMNQKPVLKEHADLMFLFYGERDYRLAWFRDDKLVPETEKFLETINQSSKEGLDPANYKLVDLSGMISRFNEMKSKDTARVELQKQIDLALSATYFKYASDFYTGRLDPAGETKLDWNVKQNNIKLHKVLQTILKERESTYPYYEFEALHDGYVQLRNVLQKYRALQQQGGWQKVELGNLKSIKRGDTAQAVLSLRKRLNPEMTANANDPNQRLYDEKLEQQVKTFQQLHGLEPDGVVGGKTLETLNVPVESRIDQIMVNMERWRWIPKRLVPKSMDQKFIWVNIPEYKLYIYEDPDNDPEAERKYKKTMEMRVIVGKTMHSTPIFSDKLEYVVVAPYWNVPNSIVANEIKPAMLRNQGYLEAQNMEIVTKEKDPKLIEASSIDWENVTEKDFPYMVRQKPGPRNALGTIKFLFPNEYAVYLHDTPTGQLFNQTSRGFSHGCVRVEKPMNLATYLLQDMPEWNESKIQETIENGEETWVTLPKKVQVYLVYFTSWVDENGNVHFREDIYGHDKKLENELFS
ncbi:L,D-transpeptidase family protein [Pontibacter qinzhouensis]|uniref:L,D-transpeptidase family protein n=1 Tax=Pontibacter qinzhouensis TaxID=2603253 RepID=A0A5C8KBG0_9BACT|nr:L,D-transpeptidase family protein [Pontibacter qinzhouensis]TXK46942.1 L,D-transpeptidase family protein [Pontibacter qinzhouensis]